MMPFKQKPHHLPRAAQTEAQRRATEQNFRIMRLRGLWCLAYILTPARREAVQAIIDGDLRDLGAEAHRDRVSRHRAQQDAGWAAEDAPDDLDNPFNNDWHTQPIPF